MTDIRHSIVDIQAKGISGEAKGTGFALRPDLIVTCKHIIEDETRRFRADSVILTYQCCHSGNMKTHEIERLVDIRIYPIKNADIML